MSIEQLRGELTEIKNQFDNFAAIHLEKDPFVSSYETMNERAKRLLVSLLSQDSVDQLINHRYRKYTLWHIITPLVDDRISRYKVQMRDLFNAGYTTGYDHELTKDFPYNTSFTTLQAQDIQSPKRRPSTSAMVKTATITEEMKNMWIMFPQRKEIDTWVKNIEDYFYNNIKDADIVSSLYTPDARHTNQLRPRRRQMVKSTIAHYLAGQESTSFSQPDTSHDFIHKKRYEDVNKVLWSLLQMQYTKIPAANHNEADQRLLKFTMIS